jgi:hypothetical protein
VRLLGRETRPEAPETAQESPSCDRFDARRLESHHQSKLFRPSLDVLDWSGVYNLLDTIIHEGLHFTRPIRLQEKSNNYDHRYISPEATRRAREQVHDFNKERKSQCGCDQ